MSDLRRFYDIMLECGMLCPPYAQWEASASENAELWPIHKHGQMVGGVLFKGHTVHIAIHPDWHHKWVSRDMLRAIPTWGHTATVEATIKADNLPAQKLARKCGFKFDADQGMYHRYIKEPHHENQSH